MAVATTLVRAGVQSKTMNHTAVCYWDTLGDSRDFNFACDVGQWFSKNEKALDKSRATQVAKACCDQFPTLIEVQIKDAHGRLAMVVR
jgi:hypothetical protein